MADYQFNFTPIDSPLLYDPNYYQYQQTTLPPSPTWNAQVVPSPSKNNTFLFPPSYSPVCSNKNSFSSFIPNQEYNSPAPVYYQTPEKVHYQPIMTSENISGVNPILPPQNVVLPDISTDDTPVSMVTNNSHQQSTTYTSSQQQQQNGRAPSDTPPKKRKRTSSDAKEPDKPVSAYALFFRDTQALIKAENPEANFGEISKIVASMWENLDLEAKNVYKQRQESARKDYLRKLASFKAKLLSKPRRSESNSDSTDSGSDTSPPKSATNVRILPSIPSVTESSSDDPTPPSKRVFYGAQTRRILPKPESNDAYEVSNTNSLHHLAKNMCIRVGCENEAVDHPRWDKEYCSSQCVILHSRESFQSWTEMRG